MTRHRKRSTASSTLGWQMRECPLSRHLGMEAPALPVPPTLAGAFHCGFTPRLDLRSAAILAVSATNRDEISLRHERLKWHPAGPRVCGSPVGRDRAETIFP